MNDDLQPRPLLTRREALSVYGATALLFIGLIAAAWLWGSHEARDREADCQAVCQARSVLPGRVTHYGCLCGDGSITAEPPRHDTIVQPVYVPSH